MTKETKELQWFNDRIGKTIIGKAESDGSEMNFRIVSPAHAERMFRLYQEVYTFRDSLLTPSADVQERAKEYADGKVDLTIRGEVVTDIGNIHADVHSALNNGYLAGASSLQAENERLRLILQECKEYFDDKADVDLVAGLFSTNKEAKLLSTITEALNKQ